ncbi:MAG: flavodoxin-dependent (E)-4-hydroxy-3-methylbut-2-enyl-diphosphate synthase [Victivallaceae bacterium]|nr:flavodoxin-dependent (E)-4-hydroxy-3-methylbut-2-enyl-diphosphate synthase [Victivallaceae bacterium]
MNSRKTRKVMVGAVAVGGGAPVSIQSMTNTDTRDAAATLAQIGSLAAAGCQIIRCAVPDAAAATALREIVSGSPLPVVADIHFDHKLALMAIAAGVAAVRINPGNIGSEAGVRAVAEAAGEAGITIRIGANSGSIAPELRKRLPAGAEGVCEGLVASALEQCAMLEKYGFRSIKVSLKASSVPVTVAACRAFADRTDYPLHIGVTEAGTRERGIVKSAVGIGALLLEGIGDTIRVSLTADPVEEVYAALRILEAVGLREAAPDLVSCPTCGRTAVDLVGLAGRVERYVDECRASGKRFSLKKIAVMGCVVNGPGEAGDADLGMAGGNGKFVIFRNGRIIATLPESEAWAAFKAELDRHII